MRKFISVLFISTPLLACAAENLDSKSSEVILEHIATITSGKDSRTDREYWRRLLNWSDECESGFHYSESFSGIKIYLGNDEKYILRVTCTLGAYQGYQQFYHLSLSGGKATIKVLQFPLYEVNNKKVLKKTSSSELWGNVLNNSDYKNITILNQYSGYGNCGTLTTYKIVDEKVTATKFRSAPDCESKASSRDADKWPEYPIP